MAASMTVSSSRHDFRKRNQKYCKAMTVNISFGAEVMRDLLVKYLKGSSLQYHLTKIKLKSKILQDDIKEILKNPDEDQLEFAQLAKLLIYSFKLSSDDMDNVNKLRKQRNILAHSTKAELDDDSVFNESSQIICALAKSACNGKHDQKKYLTDMTTKINELKRTEQIVSCCDAGRILLNNEYYAMKLVESSETSSREAGCTETVLIKYGLTKYWKELASCMDVDAFTRNLVVDRIFNDELSRMVKDSYSNEEKIQTLALFICNNASDRDIKRIINEHLRKMPQGDLLSSLIECRSDGKKQYEKYIQECVCDVLKEEIVKSDKDNLKSEELHERIETELGQDIDFNVIEYGFKQTFNNDFENRLK